MADSTHTSGPPFSRQLKVIACMLILLCIGLLVGLIVVVQDSKNTDEEATDNPCDTAIDQNSMELDTDVPNVFQDLTQKEIAGLKKYLYEDSDLQLVKPSMSKRNASYVFMAELHLPNKSDVLNYLDSNGPKPPREARVIIIRGSQPLLQINELVIGPLPNPKYRKPLPGINATLPYFYRPMTDEDYGAVIDTITNRVSDQFGDILLTCFGAKLKDCDTECLAFLYASSFSPASSGVNERKTWYWLSYDVEYYTLHPVDFSILAHITADGVDIEVVWFLGSHYKTLEDAELSFKNKSITCQPQSFPKYDTNLFSTLNKRGTPPPLASRRPPVFAEPDGKRYNIVGKHIEYMKWSFDFRLSTAYGPQLYDIRFDNQRIIYELGLQEISVYYSGNSPQQRFADYLDSVELIGPSARGLIPGIDCPNHATYVDTSHITETSETPNIIKNVFCIFELNTGEPLRRHHSYSSSEGKFFEGLENVLLVLRTVVTVANYDYVFDFRFFQNGVLETKAMSTGYVLANAFSEMEKKYGFQVHDKITASFHTHLFNFKVDLDVNGVSNRYEVIHIETETENNAFSQATNATYSQGKLRHEQKQTEKAAAYKFDFNLPKYHVFYNNDSTDKYGNFKAFRLIHKGMVKQIIPEGHNKEPSIDWARYQFAVTKHKDHEAHSSSMYSMFDTLNKVIDFQKYLDDDESIVDEDLVLWLTLGVHHIPHTEDLPLTTTAGMGLSFFLQPYNYFPEDPAMTSPNAVRIQPRGDNIYVERYGTSTEARLSCVPQKLKYYEMIMKNISIIFEN